MMETCGITPFPNKFSGTSTASSLPDKVSKKFSNCKLAEFMTNLGSLTIRQKPTVQKKKKNTVTYLALDCFHTIGIVALLAFATELLEVHLRTSSQLLLRFPRDIEYGCSKFVPKTISQILCCTYKHQEQEKTCCYTSITLLLPEMHHT